MQARLKLKPGQKGTKQLLETYGERLVCVRYRYDEQRKKRFKTVELIVEEIDWEPSAPRLKDQTMVGLRVAWGEAGLASRVKQAGGTWNREKRVWELSYGRVRELGLEDRMVKPAASNSRCS